MLCTKQWLSLCLMVFLTGCASQRVDWDYDTSSRAHYEMETWKTYAWVPEKEGKKTAYHLDGLQDRRVRTAINHDLQEKGYKLVADSDADFLVNYISTTKTRREENQVSTSLGYGMGSWGLGMQTETRVRDYEEGTLLIDFIDPASNELVWRGRSQARIPDRSTPKKRTERIVSAVAAILQGFSSNSGQ